VDPLRGREFDVVNGAPGSLPADQLGLVEPVDCLIEGDVAVADGTDRWLGAESARRST
jgi:hypothetical protein